MEFELSNSVGHIYVMSLQQLSETLGSSLVEQSSWRGLSSIPSPSICYILCFNNIRVDYMFRGCGLYMCCN